MKKLEPNPVVQQHVEKLFNDFHQAMKDNNLDVRISALHLDGIAACPPACKCGCHYLSTHGSPSLQSACNKCPE